ncbi:hypothetical protein BDV96DRAFT_630516 [Lophiotrema nucula]|uniref:DUF1566 domain-containing protein n=1 Tax=Lophiotrema nucula TaxID=690887 RepID=A0A6A5ZDI9_9PLEO|nr:hypothetical protein BDV96DRAFT_630516 [Lophiotrema nucula]
MVVLSKLPLLLFVIGIVQGFILANDNGCPNKTLSMPFEHVDKLSWPDRVHSGSNDGRVCSTGEDTRNVTLVTRAGSFNPWEMSNGAEFGTGGWAVYVKAFGLDYYGGSSWRIPSDAANINWLSSAVGYYVTTAGLSTWVNANIGGGWTVEAYLGDSANHTFGSIPYGLLVMMVKAACHSAADWALGNDNGFHFEMWSVDGVEMILSLTLLPTRR